MKTVLIEVNMPPHASPNMLEKASQDLATVMELLKGKPEAMKGFLKGANEDGYPVVVRDADEEQLMELCCRAYWWRFEKDQWSKHKPTTGGGSA